MKKFMKVIFVCSLMLSMAGCSKNSNGISPHMAKAIVQPTKGEIATGIVWFVETKDGVDISADFYGLTPGKHGFHIHEHGDCSASDGSSAGGHFNPTNKNHASLDNQERHIGDLGNIEANENGYAHYKHVDKLLKLNGEFSIIGKAIVIHSKEDDFVSQPSGNAGSRIACGSIEPISN